MTNLRHSSLRFAALALVATALCLPSLAEGRAQGSGTLPAGYFGVSPATRLSAAEYEAMGTGAIGTLRHPFFWEDIQPIGRVHFDWRKTDAVVENATVNGVPVLPYVMGSPGWLRNGATSSDHPLPDQRAAEAWAELLTRLVQRYGPGGDFWDLFGLLHPGVTPLPIAAWQISNEPNDASYSTPVATSPERYAALLKIADQAIEAVDPAAKVISAGLFGTPGNGMTAIEFLTRFYQVKGIRDSFDALGLHPYAGNIKGVVQQIEDAREIMNRAGDRRTPIWITELGWPTLDEVGDGFSTTERGQRRLLERSFKRIISERPAWRVEKIVWYTWRDNTLFANCNLCRSSGLFRKDLTPKPAWSAFVKFTGGSADVLAGGGAGPAIPLPLPIPSIF